MSLASEHIPQRQLRRNRCARLIASAIAALYCGQAGAQTLSVDQVAQEGLRRQEERIKEQQQLLVPKADLLQPSVAVAADTSLPVESPCFTIRHISVGDNRGLGSMAATAQPFLNRCIGVQGLRKIASLLDSALIDKGYVTTRVSLPQQNLADGKLAFKLHLGKVAQVRMIKAGAPPELPDPDWGTWKNAFPLAHGDVLNIRDLEQGVEQMKRLQSQSVTTRIEPGAEPDTSVVLIERQGATLTERLHGAVTLDNSGSDALGRAQLSGSLTLDNPAGLNDIFSLSTNINAQQPKHDHRSYGLSANYSIPWDYHSFTWSVSSSRFAQYVQGTTARFLSSGSSNSADAKWNYLAWRTAAAKAGVYAGLSARRANSFLDDVELVVQRRRTTSAQLGATYKQFIGQGSVDFDLAYRKGIALGSAEPDYPSAASGGLTLRPRIWSLNATFNQPFKLAGQALQYNASVRAQHTGDTTLSADQISIGGRYSVRGFDGDSVLLAESGVIVRNDVAAPLPALGKATSSVFIALDFGKLSGPSTANLVGDKLAGMAAGVRGRWQGLLFDVSVATPLHKPEKFHTRSLTPYLSITYSR